jgi:hypothetical protein
LGKGKREKEENEEDEDDRGNWQRERGVGAKDLKESTESDKNWGRDIPDEERRRTKKERKKTKKKKKKMARTKKETDRKYKIT